MASPSYQKKLKSAVQRYKVQQIKKTSREENNKEIKEKWLNQELMTPVIPNMPRCPKNVDEYLYLLTIQYGMANKGTKNTNDRRDILSNYSGAWIGVEGYVTDAKIFNGVMRLCISLPRLDTFDANSGKIIDSHVWIKMSDFQYSDIDDGRITNQAMYESEESVDGAISLGDFVQFVGLVYPYVTGKKVKYGFNKFKRISRGGLKFVVESKKGKKQRIVDSRYPRLGYLIKAHHIPGTNKFAYRFANWNEINKQKEKLENLYNAYKLKNGVGEEA
ncbi:hypothetical protein [Lactococcus allomyrinae]|uniref:Uncharacterized protein n=1 Tax=Lactococcus allomyrinae TaxID=2419773 RepID=A0A387BFQ6_9LACT|nr:hypothetical protein [Lactococcus allomyrinae]AYF99806.1 hypothetical protein D7I46_01125 [Lactococcus allomyrinae]